MKKLKSIITGGAGFIGSNLADHLVNAGHKVIVLDNFVSGKKINLENLTYWNVELQEPYFSAVEADIRYKQLKNKD